MEWRDEGIILGGRRHGETSVILEVMTQAHGRHFGLVRGGRSRRMQPLIQPGNRVDLVWRARIDEHLGTYQLDPIEHHAARLMASAVAIHGLQMVAGHLRLLPERDAHPGLYETLGIIINHLEDANAAAQLLSRFEVLLLDELGFGLDLTRCAATGATQELVYVSPKTGRAVSRQAGEPWADKMLALPRFMRTGVGMKPEPDELLAGFAVTGHFFERHVWGPRGQETPPARAAFLQLLERAARAGKTEGRGLQ